jgi:hypothetical protein
VSKSDFLRVYQLKALIDECQVYGLPVFPCSQIATERKEMQKVPLSLAAPGMKLAKPVTNKRGMVLYGAGAVLTKEIIARLSDMGVEQITAEGHLLDTGDTGKDLSQHIDELHSRFRYVEGDPLMSKIKSLLLERLRERADEA